MKRKVIFDIELHKLSDQICKLTKAIDQVSLESRKLTSELTITKNVSSMLEERIINLEKHQAKGEQYSLRNNAEFSENGSPVKLLHISDIPDFPSDSDNEN